MPLLIHDLPLRLGRTSVAPAAEFTGGIGLLGREAGSGVGLGLPGIRGQGVGAQLAQEGADGRSAASSVHGELDEIRGPRW